mgnify:CR=1 FL=1
MWTKGNNAARAAAACATRHAGHQMLRSCPGPAAEPVEHEHPDGRGKADLGRAPGVDLVGEINDREKQDFLGKARALLFPIDWPEPFGLTMVEAMATGTPVIVMACGAAPEVVESGVTGFVCRSLDEMVAAVRRVPEISREACRRHVEARFSAARMAADYEAAYERLLEARRSRTPERLPQTVVA